MSESSLFRSAKLIETSFQPDAEISLFSGDGNELVAQAPDNSIALVVTSPPDHLGKEYENRVSMEQQLGTHSQGIA